MEKARFPHDFDRRRDFVTSRPVKIRGRPFLPGEPFEKSLVSTRLLRQLYEQRNLRMAPPAPPPPAPVKPNFDAMPDGALYSWLGVRGFKYEEGLTHEELVQRTSDEWDRRHDPNMLPIDIPSEWLGIEWFKLAQMVWEKTGRRPGNKRELIEMMRGPHPSHMNGAAVALRPPQPLPSGQPEKLLQEASEGQERA